MLNKGIQILTSKAISQGLYPARYPQTKPATKTMNTEIPVSSQFGLESIQAIVIPNTMERIMAGAKNLFITGSF